MKSIIKNKNILFYLVIGVAFLIMLVLNILTPLNLDDYTYSYNLITGERNKNLFDILEWAEFHYNNYNGRIIAHIIAPIFLMFPPIVFDIINSIVFLFVGYMIMLMAKKKEESPPACLLAIIYVTMFIVIPSFGQTALWLTGSCNYLWSIASILVFIYPYVRYAMFGENIKRFYIIPFLITAIWSGGANENTSGAIILCSIFFILYAVWCKRKLKVWMFLGSGLAMINFLVMIFSPGYNVRLSHIEQSNGSAVKYIEYFAKAGAKLNENMGIFIIMVVCLFVLGVIYRMDRNKLTIACIFFVTAIAANFAMIFTPYYPDRAFMGTAIYLFVSGIILFHNLDIDWINIAKKMLIVCLSVTFCFTSIEAFSNITIGYCYFIIRERMIEEQKNENVEDIITYNIKIDNKYSVFSLGDLVQDTDGWPNVEFAKYHEIESITYNKEWTY